MNLENAAGFRAWPISKHVWEIGMVIAFFRYGMYIRRILKRAACSLCWKVTGYSVTDLAGLGDARGDSDNPSWMELIGRHPRLISWSYLLALLHSCYRNVWFG